MDEIHLGRMTSRLSSLMAAIASTPLHVNGGYRPKVHDVVEIKMQK